MFSDDVLGKILMIKELQKLTLEDQSNLVHKLEKILEEEKNGNQFLSGEYTE